MPLPPHARLAFKGVLFDVYHWEQEMFDGSTETFESILKADSVMVIPVKDGKVLLSREEQPARGSFWSLFGGKREGDEDPLLGAKRELLEEAGLASDDWELYKAFTHDGTIKSVVYVYIARGCRQAKAPHLDPGERIQVLPCTFEEFLAVVSKDGFRVYELSLDILRLRLDPLRLDAFRRRLFPEQDL